MSYIRILSNPEKLYIFGSKEGVEISQGQNLLGIVPQEDWDELCQRYVDYDYDDTEPLNVNHLWLTWDWVEDEDGRNHKAILGYKSDWIIPMWTVTWEYITSRYSPRELTNPS